jgi:CheY-like chemotaxis protein/HPt (histidine-containing phosphotransfer) domain-containing protein
VSEASIYLTLLIVAAAAWILARRRAPSSATTQMESREQAEPLRPGPPGLDRAHSGEPGDPGEDAPRDDTHLEEDSPEAAPPEAVTVAEMVRSLAEGEEEAEERRAIAGRRVLVVDDNAVNRRVAVAILEKAGFEAVEAVDGQDALDHVARSRFDLILMDVVMPRIDGIDAAAAIRASEQDGRRTVILAVTGQSQAEDVDRCLQAGMDGYVGKPFQAEALVAAVEGWLGTDVETGAGRRPDHVAESPATPSAVDPEALDELRQYGDDSLLDELVTVFLDSAQKHMTDMRGALDAEDSDLLARAAHTLKGSAGTLGAKPLAELCAELETGGRRGNLPGAKSLDDVANELSRVQSFFEEYLSTLP